MLGLVETKVVVLLLMAMLTLAASFLPLLVRRLVLHRLHSHSTQVFLSGFLCFGGGVLLATVFLHLLPETRLYIEEATASGFLPPVPYPLAELIVCVGFFFIYVAEEVVHSCVHLHQGRARAGGECVQMSEGGAPRGPGSSHEGVEDEALEKFLEREGEDGLEPPSVDDSLSVMRAVIVVVALSLHSVMEGLALGLVHRPRDVWLLFGALSAHKLVIAFCMAMELLEVGVSAAPFAASMGVFSLASPAGGVAGTLVTSAMQEATPSGVLVPTFLQGFSAGTILYVTFCEVLERERARPGGGQVRTWTFLLGFAFMAGLQVLDAYHPDAPRKGLALYSDNASAPYTEAWEEGPSGPYTEAWDNASASYY